jgi:hypothetical protein
VVPEERKLGLGKAGANGIRGKQRCKSWLWLGFGVVYLAFCDRQTGSRSGRNILMVAVLMYTNTVIIVMISTCRSTEGLAAFISHMLMYTNSLAGERSIQYICITVTAIKVIGTFDIILGYSALLFGRIVVSALCWLWRASTKKNKRKKFFPLLYSLTAPPSIISDYKQAAKPN